LAVYKSDFEKGNTENERNSKACQQHAYKKNMVNWTPYLSPPDEKACIIVTVRNKSERTLPHNNSGC
jgi:hypothetical protein